MDDAATISRPRKRPMRWLIRIVRACVLIYLGVGLVIYFLQTKLVFGGAATQGQRDARLYPSKRYELIPLRARDGRKIMALFGKALNGNGSDLSPAEVRPTILFFYGNGACLAYCTDIFDHLRRTGSNVIVVDYEGYGMSEGKPSERGCYAAADAAYDYLLTRKDVDSARLIAAGWSLGGGVAIDLASRRPVSGVITFNAFTSLPAAAHGFVPYLPVSLMIRYRFDNLKKVKSLKCPMLIVHGARDDLIAPEMSGELARAAGGHVEQITIAGAGHNDIFDVGGARLWEQVEVFVNECQPTTRHAEIGAGAMSQ